MAYTKEQIDAALVAPQRRWSFRYDIIATDGSVRGQADVLSASVANNDLATNIKRTGKFKLSEDIDFDFFRDRLRPWARLRMSDGGWHEWAMGTFHLTTSGTNWGLRSMLLVDDLVERDPVENRSVEASSGLYDAEGYDSLLVLVEDAVLSRYVVPSGTKYVQAVRDVLASAGFPLALIDSNDLALTSDKEWEPGTSKLKIVNNLLSAIGYRTLQMDPMGIPTSGPYLSPEEATPVWHYLTDRKSVIIPGIDVELDLFGIPNAWLAVSSNPDEPPLSASYINDDPSSPLSTVNRGRTIVRVIENDEGAESASQAVLNAKVLRYAREASQQYEIANLSTGLMPFHGSGDVVMIDYGLGPRLFRSHEWEMEFKAGGQMKHRFRRVVTL